MVDDRALLRKRCRGNLRPAPFSMTPDTVRQVLGLAARPARIVDVPVVAVKLVDRPRRSEDPRLAKANDDAPVAVRPPPPPPIAKQPVRKARPTTIVRDASTVSVKPWSAREFDKIDLSAAPSAMETRAESWHSAAGAPTESAKAGTNGKVWCSPCGGNVPASFGDGCISANCPLRGVR